MDVVRCAWTGDDPLYREYHDHEWGVPAHDDQHLFEMLLLEGAQAGLSWITILRKRENYRNAFDNFDVDAVAQYDEAKFAELLADPGIVRNRLKVRGFHPKRGGLSAHPGRIRQLRHLHLAIRRRQTDH